MSVGRQPEHRPLPTAVHLALQDGQFIEALKLLRAETGSDLATAKAMLDRAVAGDPRLRERLVEHRRNVRKKVIKVVLVVDALFVGLALVWWFSR